MNDAEFFLFTTLIMAVVAGIALIGWLRSSQKRTKLEGRLWGIASARDLPLGELLAETRPTMAVPAAIREGHRVERLEAQVDQLAQQLERVAESQEFLSRVLTDRIDQLPDPRMRTPH
jgi:hypothetical protein